MKDEDLRKGRHEQLLRATLSSALFALPIWNLRRCYGLNHAVGETLFALCRRHRELDQRVWTGVFVVAVVTLYHVDTLESTQLVEERQLVTEELQQLV